MLQLEVLILMFCTVIRRKIWVQLLKSLCVFWVYSIKAKKNED